MVEDGRQLSGVSFIKELITFMNALPSCARLYVLKSPKAQCPKTIALVIKFSRNELGSEGDGKYSAHTRYLTDLYNIHYSFVILYI